MLLLLLWLRLRGPPHGNPVFDLPVDQKRDVGTDRTPAKPPPPPLGILDRVWRGDFRETLGAPHRPQLAAPIEDEKMCNACGNLCCGSDEFGSARVLMNTGMIVERAA